MAESEEVVAISTPSLSKSDVWMHFGHPVYLRNDVRVTDKQHTICKLCKTILKHTGNTTNMRTHMTRHHGSVTVSGIKKPASFSTVATTETKKPKLETTHKTETQPKVASMFAKQTKYPASSQRAQIITRQIATYIVADMRPLSIVENKEFKRLLEIMDPQYSLPSRKHFSDKVIAGLYVETKNTVMNQLKGALSVSLTTDSWTSRATQSYMTVTAHYVSQDWKMHNHVLTTRMLSEAHTGENLGNALKDVVMEWQLERATQIPVVSDNASNMDIAAKTAGLHPHIKCFAHTINLASQRGLKVNAMARLLGRIRRIVAFFHKSTTATNVLASKQILLEIPRHKLVNDVATRWNSSYEMVERFLEQQPAILCALTSNEVKRNAKDIVTLSDGDINESQNAVELLKPMKVATAIMCDEHHPTVSLIYPLKTQILQSMTVKDGDSMLVKEVKNAITEDLVKRYTSPDIENFLLLTSALDPRFRSLPQLDDARRNQVYDSLHMKAVSFSQQQVIVSTVFQLKKRERSGSVVECLTRDQGAAGLSITGVTMLWSLSKTHLS